MPATTALLSRGYVLDTCYARHCCCRSCCQCVLGLTPAEGEQKASKLRQHSFNLCLFDTYVRCIVHTTWILGHLLVTSVGMIWDQHYFPVPSPIGSSACCKTVKTEGFRQLSKPQPAHQTKQHSIAGSGLNLDPFAATQPSHHGQQRTRMYPHRASRPPCFWQCWCPQGFPPSLTWPPGGWGGITMPPG